MDLKGQVALVTGASRGIGAAIAVLLGKHNARVAVNYAKSKDKADQVVETIKNEGGQAIAVQADVRDNSAVKTMVETTIKELGPIDILILNAGADVPWKAFMALTFEEFENKVMGELKGFFFPAQAVIPQMIERKKGCIVGISSGLSRHPGFGFSAHTTVKSGVDGLMKSLALELGPHGIRVNTVAPGLTITDATSWLPKERIEGTAKATPLGRVGQPDDIAGAVLMLVSDEAKFVTGAYLPVSGGVQMI
ncbi:MAG: 3-oxoacyl-ACP reductase FabG [candidate division Zixibacteria bacterium]|nr:3-oxoacyl-ACP reductase FabG [candidate division Zixibacteria bacterium]